MIEIAGRKIGPEYPPYFIADIGANHDGSLPRALSLIDQAAEAGADAVKFQNFTAPTIVSRRGFKELGKVGHQAGWEGSVYRTYMEATLPLDWTERLAARCALAGVAYLTTPYNLEVVDAIDPYVPAWKIGSGDITYLELIRHVVATGKPVLLATGASTHDEVWKALLSAVGEEARRSRLVLLQCNTNYTGDPANLSYLNLSVIPNWVRSYGCLVGLSDHTLAPLAVCAAVALGACVIEKHFTDDHSRPGPDHAFAMEPIQWKLMVGAARVTWGTLGDGIKRVEENEREAVVVQRRALRYTRDLRRGIFLLESDIIATRPCPEGALEPWREKQVVGRELQQDVEADTLVRTEDFE